MWFTYVAFSRELASCIFAANPPFCTGVVDLGKELSCIVVHLEIFTDQDRVPIYPVMLVVMGKKGVRFIILRPIMTYFRFF